MKNQNSRSAELALVLLNAATSTGNAPPSIEDILSELGSPAYLTDEECRNLSSQTIYPYTYLREVFDVPVG